MLLPHNKVSGGVQDSQIMIPSFFDRFYVMPPLTNGVHYIPVFHILHERIQFIDRLINLFAVHICNCSLPQFDYSAFKIIYSRFSPVANAGGEFIHQDFSVAI